MRCPDLFYEEESRRDQSEEPLLQRRAALASASTVCCRRWYWPPPPFSALKVEHTESGQFEQTDRQLRRLCLSARDKQMMFLAVVQNDPGPCSSTLSGQPLLIIDSPTKNRVQGLWKWRRRRNVRARG